MPGTGFYELDGSGNLMQKADLTGETDMWFELDGSGNIMPRTAEADPNFPDEDEVLLGVLYGYLLEYEGTLSAGVPVPTLTVADSADGSHATATISGTDAAASNAVWVKPRSGGTWSLQGTRTGDGTVALTITAGVGYYFAKVISTLDAKYSISDWEPFEITDPDGVRKVYYRVTGIERVPGSGIKRLSVDKIDKPLAHGE